MIMQVGKDLDLWWLVASYVIYIMQSPREGTNLPGILFMLLNSAA